ncbi:type II toxin-antitoxin system PrlF family antitoxin [Endozoicomonas sp. 8E]|uniref:type II toxin-antitoxin system PrlF family antitoxin n=1 Tax=Endozoicomonas sp. 8E TaxID=3035692 RepID=UPI002938E9F7|nr:type II toxin-antitoxin system PrlF family antitoxin [Endozoicomonas sp. 8E]WOG26579.1 type II toxin-antitoxin system PrlF family antitoxin [Endozoicomonas sp. 8E]
MKNVFVDQSTLTDRYQTTIPASVRKALELNKQEKLQYEIRSDGSVLLSKCQSDEVDPVVAGFLDFLERDMKNHPRTLKPLSPELARNLNDLVGEIDIDLDEPLGED